MIQHIDSGNGITCCGKASIRPLKHCAWCKLHGEGEWTACHFAYHRLPGGPCCGNPKPVEIKPCWTCRRIKAARDRKAALELEQAEALKVARTLRRWPDDWGKLPADYEGAIAK